MNDEFGALAGLDEAVAALGEDVVFARARAKIFWRNDKHQESVKILREIADVVGRDSPVERVFAMREAAIRAAKTNDWADAIRSGLVEEELSGMPPAIAMLGLLKREREDVVGGIADGAQDCLALGR